MRTPLVVVLLLSISTQAFAVCEQERNEFEDWNTRCEKLCAASQITGTAGGIFAIVTFGASLIPCAAAIGAAKNACRIRDEKRNNLNNCEKFQTDLANQVLKDAEILLQAKQARQNKIAQINTDYADKKLKITQLYDKKIQDFVDNFVTEGWDINDPDSQELIRTTRADMEHERDLILDQLEIDRKLEVSNA